MAFFTEIIRHFIIAIVSILLFTKIRPPNLGFTKNALLYASFVALTTSALILLTSVFNIGEPFRTAVISIVSGIAFSLILRERFEKIITIFTIVFASSFVLYSISLIISYLITSPFLPGYATYDYIRAIITAALCIAAATMLRKIKVDFSIIFKKFTNGIFLSLSGVVVILYGLFNEDISDESTLLLIAGAMVLSYGIFSWFRRETTIAKDQNANEIISRKQQTILEEKERDFAVLKNVHDYLVSVVHRDDKKLGAMKRAVEKLVMRSEQADVLEDALKILEEIDMSKSKDEIEYNENVLGGNVLPLTGLQIVDAKFETVFEQAMLKNIDFKLEVNGDIDDFGGIHEFEIANIIGDLTTNAFIAINSLGQSQSCRKILLVIGKNEADYTLSISDSGIPFNPNVLLKLGAKRITSRPNNGGSGIGFETIFKLLNEHNASLKITEYINNSGSYTKNIEINFNKKSQYIIKSYRADELRKIKLEKLETKFIIQT